LDVFLTSVLSGQSRSQIQRLIKEGNVRVAGREAKANQPVKIGQEIAVDVPAPVDPVPRPEALPLEMLCGRARVVEITSRRIAADDLAALDLSEDVRVLFKTHNSRLWTDPAFHAEYVGVTESGARHLVDHGVKVVGIDYLSVEVFKSPGAPAHHVLLGAGAIVIEGLNLRDVEPGVYDMYCLPLRVVGSDGAPARVVLRRS